MGNDRATRAEARRRWPARVHRLGDEPSESLLSSTTAAERIAMMWPLAVEAWSLAGHSVEAVSRSAMPVRCLRRRTSDPQ